jgi:hypothetical protein
MAPCMEYTQKLHDLTVVLKESAAKGVTAKTTITAPPSIEEFREQRRRKRKSSDDADKRTKKPTTSTTRDNDRQLQSKPEVPSRKFFSPLRSNEMEADHRDDANDTIERQQHQAPSGQAGRPPSVVLTSQVNLMQVRRQLKGLLKGHFEFHNTRHGTKLSRKK